MTGFNNLIKEKRENKNLTQEEVAKAIGITRSYLCDIENGRYSPSLKTSIKIATYLEIDLNSLLNMGVSR